MSCVGVSGTVKPLPAIDGIEVAIVLVGLEDGAVWHPDCNPGVEKLTVLESVEACLWFVHDHAKTVQPFAMAISGSKPGSCTP